MENPTTGFYQFANIWEGRRESSSVDFQGSGGGGLSPGKLRSLLMGVGKLRKQGRPQEDEEMDSSFDLRAQDFEIHDNGRSEKCGSINNFKFLTE
ncbi:hypothetical protein AgCh_032137 [Apium graveolens]